MAGECAAGDHGAVRGRAAGGVRVRTRLRVSGADAAVLREVGGYLGSLASADLAARCAEGRLDAKQRSRSRQVRKRELTAKSSSRWAGALTRTSEDAYQLACRNLLAERGSLAARIKRIEARLAVPAGARAGRVRGYATTAERHAKTVRIQTLRTRLAAVDQQLGTGRVSVCRGGKALLRKRNSLAEAGLTETEWRELWPASRLFLTADGDKGKTWGNETIRWTRTRTGWRSGSPPRWRVWPTGPTGVTGCPVQPGSPTGAAMLPRKPRPGPSAMTSASTRPGGAGTCTPRGRRRWRGPITLAQARQGSVVAVDVNAGHLAVTALDHHGNRAGVPYTIDLPPARLPSGTRDGQLRAAITTILATAHEHRASAVVNEYLHFAGARRQGRERTGNRPSRGRRGRAFRHQVAGIPTARFRDRLTCMAANTHTAVIAVDPAYTSRWAAQHWLAPLRQHHPTLTGHHAAALVIGRRGLGLRAPPGVRQGTYPHRQQKWLRPTGLSRPRYATGPTGRPGPKPGNPPPRRTHGSHQAPRPQRPDGPRQATRRPKTVRGRPPDRTRFRQVTRNGC